MSKSLLPNVELLQSLREVDGSAHMHFELLDKTGIVASCYVEGWERPGAYLMRVHVAPTHRNQGLGTELVKAVIRAAKADGKSGLGLSVKPDNTYALLLYHKLGFTLHYQLNNRKGDYLMSLDLTGRIPAVVMEMQSLIQAATQGEVPAQAPD